MKLYGILSPDRKTTVRAVLGLISLLLLSPSLANGVTLIDRFPRSRNPTVYAGTPQTFRIRVEGENRSENIESITFTAPGSTSGFEPTKINCGGKWPFSKDTCEAEVEYTWALRNVRRVDTSIEIVSVTVKTSEDERTWEWGVYLKEPPPDDSRDDRPPPISESTSLIINKIPMEKDISVRLRTPQKFWIEARAEQGDKIKSISFFTHNTDTNPLTELGAQAQDKKEKTFKWPRRTKDFEVNFAWVEGKNGETSHTEVVVATVRTTKGKWQQYIWKVHVGSLPHVPSSTLIIDKSPKDEDVHVPLRTSQRFWIRAKAEQGDTIESIRFFTYASNRTLDIVDHAYDEVFWSDLLNRSVLKKKCDWFRARRERECEVSIVGDSNAPDTDLVIAIVRTQKGKAQQHVWTRHIGIQQDTGPQKRPGPYRPEVLSPKIYVNASQSLNLENFFYHPDGHSLQYSKHLSKKGIVKVKWNGAQTEMTLEGVEPGTVEVTAIAQVAGSNLTAKQAFTVTVTNRAPKLKFPISDIRKSEGLVPGGPAKRISLSHYFTDPDGDTLKYHKPISNKTDVVSVEIKGSNLWITPVGGGKAKVTVTATDDHVDKLTATDSFYVTINVPPTDLSYDTLSDLQNLVINKYVWVQVNATDPDSKKKLTYAVESTKGGVVEAEFRTHTEASEYSRNMRIKPINIGTDTLKVTVSDDVSSSILDIPVKVPDTDTNRAESKSDLAILEFTASKDTLDPDETFTLDVSVENKGSVATSKSKTLSYYLWSNPPTTADWQDAAFKTSSVKKLNAGEVYDAKSIDIKAPTRAGTYYYGAYVFPDKKESNWDNNRSNVIEITVTGQNSQNRPPSVIIENPKNLTFEITGNPYAIYVSELFRDPDSDPLRYTVWSSDPSVATASIGVINEHGDGFTITPHGNDLIITPLRAGTTTITMIATDRQQQTATLIINLTVTGGVTQDDYWIDAGGSFQNFHVVYHNLPETADLGRKVKAVSGMRLADWNDIVAYYNGGGSMADFMNNLGIQGGQNYHVTWNGAEIWNGGLADGRKRRYFFARHDHNKPGHFLAHADIDNHLLTLGSWYSTGGLALCYGTPNWNWSAAPLRIRIPVTPTSTAVLPNYPNPFNPETWIPYQLATPAEVTLAIYNVQGTLVRQLALGHQPAGFYHSRSRAAYWDGKNAFGERVASGVYFYQFQAGNVSSLRKMLILK